MRFLIIIFVGLLSSQAFATVMNFQQFKKLSVNQQVQVIEAYKDFIKQNSMELELEEQSFSLNWKLIQEAYAASSYNCFYAGWPSTKVLSQGRALCSSPAKTNADYKAQSASCSRNEILCNPVLFGTGICVSIATKALRNSAFNQCEQEFKAAGNDLNGLAQKLASAEHSSEAEELFGLVDDVCSKTSSGICTKLKARVQEIKASKPGEASTAATPTPETTTQAEPSDQASPETAATTTTPETTTQAEPTEQTTPEPSATTSTPATSAPDSTNQTTTEIRPSEAVTISSGTTTGTTSTPEPIQTQTSNPEPSSGSCSEINLIAKENSPFNKIPVYQQGGTDACYAYAAAQLMNYELIDSGRTNDKLVHPLWAAVMYGKKVGHKSIAEGHVSETLEALRKNSICRYDAAEGAIAAWARVTTRSEVRVIQFIDDYGDILARDLRSGKINNETTRKDAFRRAAELNSQYCTINNWFKIFPEVDAMATNSIDVADRLMASQCQQNNLIRVDLPQAQTIQAGTNQEIDDRINSVLERGKPLGISMCSRSIERPGQGFPTDTVSVQSNPPPYNYRQIKVPINRCGSHGAMIAGRKEIAGKCHYLYRNSKGNKWDERNKHYKCVCRDGSGKVVPNCTANANPNLSVEACWVPAEKFTPNITQLHHY